MRIGCQTDQLDFGYAWRGVIGARQLKKAIYCETGYAEPTCCMLEFEDGTFEVGTGEVLRPYTKLYEGTNVEEASNAFIRQVAVFAKWLPKETK